MITHGNGPQVGNELLRHERAAELAAGSMRPKLEASLESCAPPAKR